MRRRFPSRPSPAMIVAFVALFAATGGGAYAATQIDGSQIVVHSIRGIRLHANAVGDYQTDQLSGAKIRPHTLRGNRLFKSAVGGYQVDESTLGTVPRAASADAVGGQTVQHFLTAVAAGGSTTVLHVDGVDVVGGCAAGNHLPSLQISNTTTPQLAGRLNLEVIGSGNTAHQSDGVFTSRSLLAAADSINGTGTANVAFSDGRVVTIEYSYDRNGGGAFKDCTFYGHATAG